LNVGEHIEITTTDGHALRGRVALSSPDRLILIYEGGMHVIYRRAIAAWRRTNADI
jgi:hypothetical protein